MTTMTNENRPTPLSNDDLLLFGNYVLNKQFPTGKEAQIKRLARRGINLADTAAIIDFVTRTQETAIMESMQMILEKLNVLEYIVTEKLEVDADTFQAYAEEYQGKLEAFLAEMQAEFADVDSYEIEALSETSDVDSLIEGY